MALPSARRCAGLSLLVAPLGALAIATAPAAAATSGDVNNVCPWGSNDHRVISRGGPASTCREGVPVMKAWVKAHKPKQFRNYRCGEVKATHVGFTEGFRWFATWQCRRSGGATYTIWTRY